MISQNCVPAESVTIEDLPNEILERIFNFLNLPDRKSVSLVCHRWNASAFQWKQIVVVIESQHEFEYDALLASNRPYQHLEIPARWLTPTLSAKFASSLESLTLFKGINMNSLSGIQTRYNLFTMYEEEDLQPFESFSKMRELTLESLTFGNNSSAERFICKAFPALVSLHAKNSEISGRNSEIMRFSSFVTLEELKIETKFPLGFPLLQDLQMLPKLRSLDVTCPEFNIFHHGQHIQLNQISSLSIEAQLDEDCLLSIANLFPALSFLKLKTVTQFSAEIKETARNRLPNCVFKFEYHINRVQNYHNEFFELY